MMVRTTSPPYSLLYIHPTILLSSFRQARALNAEGEKELGDLKNATLKDVSKLSQKVLFAMMVVRQVKRPNPRSLPTNVNKGNVDLLNEALAAQESSKQPTPDQTKEFGHLIYKVHALLKEGKPVITEEIEIDSSRLPPIPADGKMVSETVSFETMMPKNFQQYLVVADKCLTRSVNTVRHMYMCVRMCASLAFVCV